MFLLVLTACAGPRAYPEAQKGVLDLRGLNLSKEGPIALDGEWRFSWQKFITPGLTSSSSPLMVKFPGTWKGTQSPEGRPFPEYGYATYELKILTNDKDTRARVLALKMPDISSASVLYVNGVREVSTGELGQWADTSRAAYKPYVVDLPGSPGLQSYQLTLHIANFDDHRGGGIHRSIFFGTSSGIREMRNRQLFLDLFLIGALVIMGFYHLSFYIIRSDDRSPLFFGLYCLCIALRTIGPNESLIMLWFPNLPYQLLMDFLFLPVTGAIPCLLYFVYTLYPKYTSLNLCRGTVMLCGLFALFVVATPGRVYDRILTPSMSLLLLATFIYIVYIILMAMRNKMDGARIFIAGFSIFFLAVFNDILRANRIIATDFIAPYGFLVLVFSQAIILSKRFSKAFGRVESLSHDLMSHSTELAVKNDQLLDMDRIKDEFLANTSHELRTPLNGIIGISESLMQGAGGEISDVARSNLQMVASSGRRLASLVNDVMDFSRLRHSDIKLTRKPVDICSLIDVALALSRHLIGEKDLELSYEKNNTPPAFADENRVEQILLNLLANAIKFTPAGKVIVSSRTAPENPDMIEVEVKDTGIGIPLKKQKTVFDAFVQLDGSESRLFSGTGLGLSITRKLVELHGGGISLKSQEGVGSSFRFTLPISRAKPLPPSDRAKVSPWVAEPTPPRETLRVTAVDEQPKSDSGIHTLIVDDDPINLQVLKNQLSLQQHVITTATNGDEALGLFAEGKLFDLVLLDVMMPGLSGYEVCRKLRLDYSATELPIILLTAKNRVSDMLTGFESGANDYLVKPFDARELLARVNTMLSLKEAALTQSRLTSLRNELNMARDIQESLLPDAAPDLPGLHVAARYRPMLGVGGDFYDFRTGENKLSVLLADVSGHGVPAALIVSMIKIAFWFQKETLSRPSELLPAINSILVHNIRNEFATALYLHIDLDNKTLTTTNGGHPPLLLWKRKEKKLQLIRPKGTVLGIIEGPVYPAETIQLESHDRIVIFTDGIPEAESPDLEMFGDERLYDFIAEHDHTSPEDFADLLLERVIQWSGGEEKLADDIAFVVLDLE